LDVAKIEFAPNRLQAVLCEFEPPSTCKDAPSGAFYIATRY
jgi:hypothetical protein